MHEIVEKKQETKVTDFYSETRNRTEEICSPLNVEDYILQPVDFASPPKWHLAHATWFFEEMILKKFIPGYKEHHPQFGFLFNSYYNTLGTRTFRADRGNITRPRVEEVYAYRKHVDGHMKTLLENNQEQDLIDLVILGCNHEQQHQELLITDLKFSLGHNPISPIYSRDKNLVRSKSMSVGFLEIKEGVYTIGHDGNGFHFDNEVGQHKVYLHDFEIRESLVTNGEFLEFIENDGYQNFNFWLDEGWTWVNEHKKEGPLYWHKIDGDWHYYTLAGLQKVDPNAVLSHISYYEANAFATWKGMRLPTEFEWEVAAEELNWGERWEWTNSAYLPYPGFKIASGAVGEYNGKFMVNQMVLRGSSVATSKGHSRKTYRNFFQAKHQWQFTGIRLARHI
ncbi:MAG: ergothioneine biosynthesis protein EgtB [Patiriisocius sp.]|jgi:ergothioneine biosynthesis protein EgtB